MILNQGSPHIKMTRESEMAELYKSGHTLAEIGVRYNLSRERIRQILKKQGVKMYARKAYDRKFPDHIVPLVLLAKKLGVSTQTLRKRVDDLGIEIGVYSTCLVIRRDTLPGLEKFFPSLERPKCVRCKRILVWTTAKYKHCYLCIRHHISEIPEAYEAHKEAVKRARAKKFELQMVAVRG